MMLNFGLKQIREKIVARFTGAIPAEPEISILETVQRDEPMSAAVQQLVALIAQLPPEKAEILRRTLESETLSTMKTSSYRQLLRALNLRKADMVIGQRETLMRRICAMFEGFLVDELPPERLRGMILRNTLDKWWKAALRESADLRKFEQIFAAAIRAENAAEADDITETARQMLIDIADEIEVEGCAEDIAQITELLGNGPRLREALIALEVIGPRAAPRPVRINGSLIAAFGFEYEKAGHPGGYNPVWLGYGVMNHLERPWDIITLIGRVTDIKDVSTLEQLELAPLIDRAIDQVSAMANSAMIALKQVARNGRAADIRAAAQAMEAYFEAAEDISLQIKIERSSQWGQRFVAARKNLCDIIEENLKRFEEVVTDFVGDWSEKQPINEVAQASPAFAIAEMFGMLKPRAVRHGIGLPYTAVERRVVEMIGRTPPGLSRQPEAAMRWTAQKRGLLAAMKVV